MSVELGLSLLEHYGTKPPAIRPFYDRAGWIRDQLFDAVGDDVRHVWLEEVIGDDFESAPLRITVRKNEVDYDCRLNTVRHHGNVCCLEYAVSLA